MSQPTLSRRRARQLLHAAAQARVLVVGDVILDQFVWGSVARISPEAPVPVVDFERESYMPGGAANVARNLSALHANTDLFGVIGADPAGGQLRRLLHQERVGCTGLLRLSQRHTSVKTRIVAQKQQVVRVDRETRDPLNDRAAARLLAAMQKALPQADAVIVGDYGKGVATDALVGDLKRLCRQHGVWLSLDPKPMNRLDLTGLSLITPNRREAFELAGLTDLTRHTNPLADTHLLQVADTLLTRLQPAILLITLGEQGILLCQRGQRPFHIATVARDVFDVSGAGDTVIATFTLAIAAGAAPVEAAILANHAAGLVVGKIGTATVTPDELLGRFGKR